MLGVTIILLSNLGSIGGSLRRGCPGKCHGLFLQAPLPEADEWVTISCFRAILGSFDRPRMRGTRFAQG